MQRERRARPSPPSRKSCPTAAHRTMSACSPKWARCCNRRARTLPERLFPLGEPPMVETVRQRTLRVGARLERQAIAPRSRPPSATADAITLSIDSGHVKSVRSYQVRSFEIFVPQAGNDGGKSVTFAGVPAEAWVRWRGLSISSATPWNRSMPWRGRRRSPQHRRARWPTWSWPGDLRGRTCRTDY